jgi:group I intron endonuclease
MKFLVYKITNTENNKIYIGKTKEYYGEKYFGIEGRLSNHLTCAFTKSKFNDCPRLYNAIRKYGKDKFKIELLEESTEDNIDSREIYYINLYNSTDDNVGYNIALGGGGRSVVNVGEDIRIKISKAQTKEGELNIKPYLNDDKVHTGYFARRRENGKVFQKYFTSQKFTLEENLAKAKEWIENIKTNKDDNALKYNKTSDLPKNINYIRDENDKTKIIGYRVDVLKNGVKTTRSFQSKLFSLEELLAKAIECKTQILNA